MKLFVTGASGFLGSAVVDAAVARGHEVVRLVRTVAAPGQARPGVTDVEGDVRYRATWDRALAGVDAVVHLAAAKGGDFHTQFATTVLGTEVLLGAMRDAGVRRLVHISTFSVYDYRAVPVRGVLDERSPLEARPLDRDDYAQTKLVQERLVQAFADEGGLVTIIRPGAVYGPGNLWNAGMAAVLPGGLGLAFAPFGRQKLTYVDNCADAIVLAAERSQAIGATIDVVDDHQPTQRAFARAQRRAGLPVARAVPVPYRLAMAFATALDAVNRRFIGGRAKLPGIVVPARLDAQFRPLRYPNDEAKRILGWTPRVSLDAALARSASAMHEQASS